ncbi:hypothetical protein CNX65_18235 [Actinosynnema pretiosum]|uniref:Uncharacterized protein n=1 Tax=Actinosynnema pretiosum TaxID=42197 RepID=A0A290Z7M7_9PSEU|nr:hypothetical protein CNX65_18235 [Actinosynnema pretiosum]
MGTARTRLVRRFRSGGSGTEAVGLGDRRHRAHGMRAGLVRDDLRAPVRRTGTGVVVGPGGGVGPAVDRGQR